MAYQAANRDRLRLPPAPASSLGFRHSFCYSWAARGIARAPLKSASLRPFICDTLRDFDALMWWAISAPLSPRLRAPLQCFCFRGTFTCPFPLSSATIAGSLEHRDSASIQTAVLLPVIPTPLRNRVSMLGYLVLHPPLSPLAPPCGTDTAVERRKSSSVAFRKNAPDPLELTESAKWRMMEF
ncbi:hypothetical protein FB451DRAFT_1178625 [Mycena latifolia]|nr:hypothetical protein FB451DRAFT_1178625 [Mycena latifolia]